MSNRSLLSLAANDGISIFVLVCKHKSACDGANLNSGSKIGDRVKRVRMDRHLHQQEIADLMGLSLRAWQKMERDEGIPSGETLMLFERIGINPGWVLTGYGPMRIGEEEQRPASMEAKLMRTLGELVERVHAERRIRLPVGAGYEVATELYMELTALVADVRQQDVVDAMIPILEQRLRKRLDDAAADPGSGKRLA